MAGQKWVHFAVNKLTTYLPPFSDPSRYGGGTPWKRFGAARSPIVTLMVTPLAVTVGREMGHKLVVCQCTHISTTKRNNQRRQPQKMPFWPDLACKFLILVTGASPNGVANASAVSELFGVKLAVGTDVDTPALQQLMWVHVDTPCGYTLYSNWDY